ncbi:CynX/NimT family MFS transporter [Peribacillus kribbensis]|uniref:CynX/NimT family MFS transporter n=1 Tax=Peribacillus kribbensis TaxID=356658 RepID=UPI0003FF80B0|nr:MFS transporter [Peribacillus kribbensis]
MQQRSKSYRRNQILLIAGIIFIAFNLRPAITAVGPIIGSIRADMGLSNGIAGLITTLPLLSFAVLSLLAPKIGYLLGNERSVFIGLIILIIGICIRSAGFNFTLFIGTALLGVGIAIGNVLLPSIVKQNFPERVGLMTSIYSTSMTTFAAFGSGISIPLAQGMQLGWQKALLSWSLLAMLAACIWIPQLQRNASIQHVKRQTHPHASIWRSAVAWQVTLFMGLQSFIFFSTVAWIPDILHSHGISIATSGWMLSFMQFISLPTTFLAPLLASRLKNQISIIIGIGVLYFLGILGLFAGHHHVLVMGSIVCIGLSQGATISLALALIGLRSENAVQAAELSGMAQSVGYFCAAAGPILLGFLLDRTHSWTPSILVLMVIVIIMTAAGAGAGRNKYVLESKNIVP